MMGQTLAWSNAPFTYVFTFLYSVCNLGINQSCDDSKRYVWLPLAMS